MASLLLLLVCALLGILAARYVKGATAFTQPLNWWVLHIALPALVLELIPKLEFEWHLWFLPVSQWLIFLGSWGCFVLLGRALHWSRQRIGAVTLTAGLGNTMYIGYPVIEALLGRDSLPYAVVADQAGSFLAVTIGGAAVTAIYGGQNAVSSIPLGRAIWQRLVKFPAVYALLLGVGVGALGGWPAALDEMLLRLGGTLTPLALFSVGLQFSLRLGPGRRAAVAAGLGWKLVAAPLVVYLMGAAAGLGETMLAVGVLQAAMPPMVAAAILANQYDLEPDLANTILAIGILVSALTLPLAGAGV